MRETRPIIALDFASVEEVRAFLALFPKDESLYVKIGMELFYAAGSAIVHEVREKGHDIFLDLKLHDIPNTVASAMRVLGELGISMTNVHAAGGLEMMQAAREELDDRIKLIAVTQLTSTDEVQMRRNQNIQTSLLESVVHYAKKSKEAGLDGVVCSAKEVESIKEETGKEFICLTPGIRPSGASKGDQKRVMTPNQARQIGSDFIVVGRPITRAEDPVVAYHQITREWNDIEETLR